MKFKTTAIVASAFAMTALGACSESEQEAKDWALRQRAALCEKVRLSEHGYDPRKYDPVAATLERGV